MNKAKSLPIGSLIQKIRSGVIHIEFLNEELIGSGSGFLSQNYLITNNHVYQGSLCAQTVKLTWQPEATAPSAEEITIPATDFQGYLRAGSDENNNDFAILDVPALKAKNLYNFSLATHKTHNLLDEILILGFPLEHRNLVCHRGVISSFFTENGIDIIQLDASINQSNSGGPLVDLNTGEVIGIITRKGTGLTKIFHELLLILDENIKAAKNMPGGIVIGGVDPRRALIIGQNQMRILANEIFRSANVGIGYAFSINQVQKEIENFS